MRESGLISKIDRDWNFLLPRLLNYNPKDEAAAWKIRKYYFGDSSRSIQNQLQNLTNLFSDKMFFSPTKKAADIHSRFAPTYLYYFTYRTPVTVYDLIRGVTPAGFLPPEIEIVGHMTRSWIESNVFRMKTGMEGKKNYFFIPLPRNTNSRTSNFIYWFSGACHGDELSILYNTNFFSEIGKSSKHYPFAKAFVKLWADFAKGRNK
jgi:carboxylesterase type B